MEKRKTAVNGSKGALRLVSTKGMSREDWLDVRKRGIGASDAAAAIGASPYQSQLELWMTKTGRDGGLPKVDPNDMGSPMYWGHILEPIVAEAYARKTGNKVRRVNAVLQHPEHSWMLANLDYAVVGSNDVQILECKTAGQWGSKLWMDGVPEYVQLQVQHQLAVTGKASADVCVLLCGQEIQVHRIERDEAVIERLIAHEAAFWDLVTSDTAPEADGSESSGMALQGLYPKDAGYMVDFSESPGLCGDFDELLDVREQVSRLQGREMHLKQRIQESMGEASRGLFPGGGVSWRRSKDSTVLDTKRLLEDQPELLEQYPSVRPGSRRFTIRT